MRRLHVHKVDQAEIQLSDREAHHARDVLRLTAGAEVEVFDQHGNVGNGQIIQSDKEHVVVRVHHYTPAGAAGFHWTIASAIPKGNRADWMVEKLSELGTHRFIPLATARSVVVPEGKNKVKRWQRLAEESAKQSKRRGIMQMADVSELAELLKHLQSPAWYLSTADDSLPISKAIDTLNTLRPAPSRLLLFIGPEGGWSDDEIRLFNTAGLTAVRMGATILRVETAAVAAAAIVATMLAPFFQHKNSESA